MSMINSLIGSSIWQHGLDYQPSMAASVDDDSETWRKAVARLTLAGSNHQLIRSDQFMDNDEYFYYKKVRLSDIPQLRNLGLKEVQQNCDNKQHPVAAADKWYKTLPPGEMLPRNEVLGGYIFVCNNETMQEDLRRQLFGLPKKYKDSVRAITPGLPLFLYNYTSHHLHGVFQAVSFGGSNIDPTAWEDKKCTGESRFPAQVRITIKKKCKPLGEDSFRPILYHYDGPKFRLQLSVPEALSLLDLFKEEDI